jgi:hypothetical protein
MLREKGRREGLPNHPPKSPQSHQGKRSVGEREYPATHQSGEKASPQLAEKAW